MAARYLALSFSAVLVSIAAAATGCGSGDPLVGTWTNAASAGGLFSATTTLTFRGDNTATLRLVMAYPADAADAENAGCTTTTEASNFRWTSTPAESGEGGTLSYSGAATVTLTRSGCTDPTQNREPITATGEVPAGSLNAITGPYSVSEDGRTLTIQASAGGSSFATVLLRE